ncbi:hypothetical protein Trydic_g16206 [Trypoxylus dichotomus]
MYAIQVKRNARQFTARTSACKESRGKILIEKEDILTRCKEYFEGVLVSTMDHTDYQVQMTTCTAEAEDKGPTCNEVVKIFKCLKNHKAPSTDRVSVELLKHGSNRPITLLNVTYKILSGIIYNGLTKYAEDILGNYQSVFPPNHSTMNHVSLNKQAFDNVNRNKMVRDLQVLGVPKKLVDFINMTMLGFKAVVRVDNQRTAVLYINTGSVTQKDQQCWLYKH